jgi:hypothetical protein
MGEDNIRIYVLFCQGGNYIRGGVDWITELVNGQVCLSHTCLPEGHRDDEAASAREVRKASAREDRKETLL